MTDRNQKAASRPGILPTVLCVLPLALAVACGNDDSAKPEPPPPSDCIQTPEQYKAAWDAFEVACVAPHLYGTAPYGANTEYLYYPTYAYAWGGGSTNLEKFLELRSIYGDPQSPLYNATKAVLGIEAYIGFPVEASNGQCKFPGGDTCTFTMVVFTLPDGVQARVPSFETWFKILEDDWNLVYPLDAQKEMVLAYSDIPFQDGVDVVDVFTELTGCPSGDNPVGPDNWPPIKSGSDQYDSSGCYPSYIQARAAAGYYKVGGASDSEGTVTTLTTEECFTNFFDFYEGPRNAGAIRGVLEQCQDASSLNTGVGLGYNPGANPFVCKPLRDQSVVERYTGREFIFENIKITKFPKRATVEMTAPDGPYEFLTEGYCS